MKRFYSLPGVIVTALSLAFSYSGSAQSFTATIRFGSMSNGKFGGCTNKGICERKAVGTGNVTVTYSPNTQGTLSGCTFVVAVGTPDTSGYFDGVLDSCAWTLSMDSLGSLTTPGTSFTTSSWKSGAITNYILTCNQPGAIQYIAPPSRRKKE